MRNAWRTAVHHNHGRIATARNIWNPRTTSSVIERRRNGKPFSTFLGLLPNTPYPFREEPAASQLVRSTLRVARRCRESHGSVAARGSVAGAIGPSSIGGPER